VRFSSAYRWTLSARQLLLLLTRTNSTQKECQRLESHTVVLSGKVKISVLPALI
jgi:hypothetical protein